MSDWLVAYDDLMRVYCTNCVVCGDKVSSIYGIDTEAVHAMRFLFFFSPFSNLQRLSQSHHYIIS